MAIEQGEIEKIAELSRIRISDEEIGQVTQRITEILQMVELKTQSSTGWLLWTFLSPAWKKCSLNNKQPKKDETRRAGS